MMIIHVGQREGDRLLSTMRVVETIFNNDDDDHNDDDDDEQD